MDSFLQLIKTLWHDGEDLVVFLCEDWILVASGVGGLLITMLGYYHWAWLHRLGVKLRVALRRSVLPAFTMLLVLYLLPAGFWAWHDLENKLRDSEEQNNRLSKQLADDRKSPAAPPIAVDIGSKQTSGSASPIVSGSGNSFTYGSPPPDKPTPAPSRKKP